MWEEWINMMDIHREKKLKIESYFMQRTIRDIHDQKMLKRWWENENISITMGQKYFIKQSIKY